MDRKNTKPTPVKRNAKQKPFGASVSKPAMGTGMALDGTAKAMTNLAGNTGFGHQGSMLSSRSR